jgi:hypothetical protein
LNHRLTARGRRAAATLAAGLAVVLTGAASVVPSSAATPPPAPTFTAKRVASSRLGGSHQTLAETAHATLGTTTFGTIAVDATYGHVYVSSPGSNSIAVFNLDGTYLHTLTGLPGADHMLVDGRRLYVALDTTGQIELIDNSDQHYVRPFLSSALVAPGAIVKAGGYLWTTTGSCGSWTQQWVRVDPATGATTTGALGGAPLGYCSRFVSDPQLPNTLLTFEDGGVSPSGVARYDISTGSPVLVTSISGSTSNAHQMAVSPDGSRFVVASGSPYSGVVQRVDNLAPSGTVFPAVPYPTAVAMTGQRGGLIALGMDGAGYTADLRVYSLGNHSLVIAGGTFTDGSTTLPGGLAFSPGGSKVYVVHASSGGRVMVDTELVTQRPTTTKLILPTSGSVPFPASVEVRTQFGTRPTGSVTLYDGSKAIRSIPLSHGNGTIHVILGMGNHDLWAFYRGNSTAGASVSNEYLITIY